jgi:hypothetical protein
MTPRKRLKIFMYDFPGVNEPCGNRYRGIIDPREILHENFSRFRGVIDHAETVLAGSMTPLKPAEKFIWLRRNLKSSFTGPQLFFKENI